MVLARANWKGFIKFGEIAFAVGLYSATSSSERVAFNMLNRATGNRVRRVFLDSETGEPVAHDDQVKGYELDTGEFVVLEPDEIAAAVPESDKTLKIEVFVPCAEIDDVFFDKPYYLAPAGADAEAFITLRDAMRSAKVAAIARTVLFRRLRTVLIRAHDNGLIGTTLNFDYEVRSPKDAFSDLPALKIEGEMLDLAKHIISTKSGTFDPRGFEDRYHAALAELVKAKVDGRPLPKKKAAAPRTSDLLQALRESAGMAGGDRKSASGKTGSKAKQPKRAGRSKHAA